MTTTQLDLFIDREWITTHFIDDVCCSAPEPLRWLAAKRFTLAKAKEYFMRKNVMWFCKPPKFQQIAQRNKVEYYRGYS